MRNHKTNHWEFPISNTSLLTLPVTIASNGQQVKLSPGRNKIYFKYTFLHSYAFNGQQGLGINYNGATFFYPLLRRYIATAEDSPIDIEHELEGSPLYEDENRLVGHVVYVEINKDLDENELFPDVSQPVKCIGVLYSRLGDVGKIVSEINEGVDWRISMEVDRDWDQDVLVHGKKIIKQDDELWDAVYGAWAQNKLYDDHEIGLALGGTGLDEKNYADFFGTGIVRNPADPNAAIESLIMAPMATKGDDPRKFIGIAVQTKKGNVVKRKKELGQEEPKILIESPGKFSGTKLFINGEEVQPLRYLSLWMGDEGEDDYFSLRFSMEERDGDIVKTIEYQFDPATGTIIKGELEMTPNDLEQIKTLIAESEKKFEGYKSPEEIEAMIGEAVADFSEHKSPDEVKDLIKQAVDNALAEKGKKDVSYESREKALTEANLDLTDDRKVKIREFEVSEEGDNKFKEWLEALKTGQDSMVNHLRENEIEVNDAVKKQIASFDGEKDPRFLVAVSAIQAASGRVVEVPSDNGPEETQKTEVDLTAL